MWADPIADLLTRIRNGIRIHKETVLVPSSRVKVGVVQVLHDEGYIKGFDVIEDTTQNQLRIELKYGPRGEEIIHKLDRVSKPGCRIYRKATDIPRVLNGMGIAIVSTPKGVMSDRQCRSQNVGGELLCTVY